MIIENTFVRSPVECAQEQLDAYNARDIDRFSQVYSPSVKLIDLSSGETFCSGRQALIERYGAMFERSPLLNCTLVSRISCPPFVIDEEEVIGLAPSGSVHAIATYEVFEGLITRAWFIREVQP